MTNNNSNHIQDRTNTHLKQFDMKDKVNCLNPPTTQNKKCSFLKYIFITAGICLLFLSVMVGSILYICDRQDKMLSGLTNEITSLKTNFDELKLDVKNINSSIGDRSFDDVFDEIDNRFADLEIKIKNVEGKASISSDRVQNNVLSSKPTCAFGGCDSTILDRNSNYCYRHTCRSPGCVQPISNTHCRYCLYHKCAVPNCNSGASYNSIYCLLHK